MSRQLAMNNSATSIAMWACSALPFFRGFEVAKPSALSIAWHSGAPGRNQPLEVARLWLNVHYGSGGATHLAVLCVCFWHCIHAQQSHAACKAVILMLSRLPVRPNRSAPSRRLYVFTPLATNWVRHEDIHCINCWSYMC